MKERIFNLFAIVEDEVIYEVAIACHEIEGSYREKENLLRERAASDWNRARRYPVPGNYLITNLFDPRDSLRPGIPYTTFCHMEGENDQIAIFEQALIAVDAPMRPLIRISVIHNNRLLSLEEE